MYTVMLKFLENLLKPLWDVCNQSPEIQMTKKFLPLWIKFALQIAKFDHNHGNRVRWKPCMHMQLLTISESSRRLGLVACLEGQK